MMSNEESQAARHVLWTVSNPNGYEPGGFTRSLLEAWGHADYINDAKLSAAFPELGAAIAVLKRFGPDPLVAQLKDQS